MRGVNLVPAAADPWSGPLIVANAVGMASSVPQTVGRETFVSWGVRNRGDAALGDLYFIDLYFDEVVINRWSGVSLAAEEIATLVDWPNLNRMITPAPGTHSLKLVVDSTNLIAETDETDNVYETQVVWLEGDPAPAPERPVSRLPDLAVTQLRGVSDVLVASPYSNDVEDWPLSVDLPSFVVSAFENRGLSSVLGPVRVDLYYDDVLVAWRVAEGMIAGDSATRLAWSGIDGFVRLTPGEHTLRVVVDPADLIEESDETNNSFEKVFTWSTGPVPTKPAAAVVPEPPLPEPLTLVNLQPGWIFDSDGPISLFHEEGQTQNPPLIVGQDVKLRVSVKNRSSVGTRIPFTVDIYFDGELVNSLTFRSGIPSTAIASSVWDGLAEQAEITPGEHTLKIVIDARDSIREVDEEDNVFERTFTWLRELPPEETPMEYSAELITERLSGLRDLLDSRELAVTPGGADYSDLIIDIVDAGQYLMTGSPLDVDRVDIHILDRKDYQAWIDRAFEEQFASAGARDMPRIHSRYERLKEYAVGITSREEGRIAVIIDGERPIPMVMDTLAHEVGHVRQDLLNPDQHDAAGFDPLLLALMEGQAQQFQRAFWLTIEEFVGETLLEYPRADRFRQWIAQKAFAFLGNAEQDEHALGYLLQWLLLYADPELESLATELEEEGSLSARSSMRLYDYLVGLSPRDASLLVRGTYGRATTNQLAELYNRIVSVASERLVPELHPDDEGVATLRIVGLLTP